MSVLRIGHEGRAEARRSPRNLIADLIGKSRGAFSVLVLISIISNLLMLTGPLYMLQVYDRVLVARSVPTLLALSILAASLFGLYAVLEILRSRMTLRYAGMAEEALGAPAIRASIRNAQSVRSGGDDPVRELDVLQQFLRGSGPTSLLDLPWVPIYLGLVFLFHPALGWVAVGGGLMVTMLLVVNERFSQRTAQRLRQAAQHRQAIGDDARNNAEPVIAMGMLGTMARRWEDASSQQLEAQIRSLDQSALYSGVTKSFRLMLQSAVLGVGAYLVIHEMMTPGLMIAASVITARALAPVEQMVGQWRGFVGARQAYGRIRKILDAEPDTSRATELELPRSDVSVRQLTIQFGAKQRPVVNNVNFRLSAGDGLGILGPSGSGKSTLARAIVGLLPLNAGEIRLDGSELGHFDRDRLGAAVGYLPQDVDLFDGTISENIARFRADATTASILAAAEAADVHGLIASLPNGYDTKIGPRGAALSGGQRQRIGLARALFGNPFLLVLDEPNSNLDGEGEEALTNALIRARHAGSVVIVVAHRRSAIAAMNKLLFLDAGEQGDFGPRDEVMSRLHAQKIVSGIAPVRTGTNG